MVIQDINNHDVQLKFETENFFQQKRNILKFKSKMLNIVHDSVRDFSCQLSIEFSEDQNKRVFPYIKEIQVKTN